MTESACIPSHRNYPTGSYVLAHKRWPTLGKEEIAIVTDELPVCVHRGGTHCRMLATNTMECCFVVRVLEPHEVAFCELALPREESEEESEEGA